jgi:hypothetical protein
VSVEATAPVTSAAAPEAVVSETSAPAAEPTGGHVEAKSDEAKAASYKERRARAMSIFAGKSAEGPAVEAAPEVEAAPVAAEPETQPAVDVAAPEPSAKDAARLAKMAVDLKERNAEALKLRNEAKARDEKHAADLAERDGKLNKLQAQLDKFLADPRAALQAHGGYDAVTKKVLAGELKMPTPDEVLAEQMAERMSPLERELAELKAERAAEKAAQAKAQQDAQAQATRTNDLGVVKNYVESASEAFPFIAAHPGGHEWLLDLCYRNQTQDIEGQAKALEQHLESQALAYARSPKALARLTKADPKVRETISGVIKPADQSRKNPVSSEGPRVLARDVVSAPTTPIERPKTAAERKARAVARLFGNT